VLLAVAAIATFGGCYSPLTEIVSPHVEPGGTLTATLGSAPPLTTKALADGTVDPMTITGTSPELVFGLIVGTDVTTGMAAKALLLGGQAVQLSVAAGSQLSVHLGGQSCATTQATINLKPDGNGNLNGDFVGTGAGCSTSGTLSAIPINH
jgi:hypothetical protein